MSANTIWQRLLSFFPEVVKGNSGAAPAVDWTAGSVQSITLNAATVTPTFTAPPGGASLALVVTQDGVGGRNVVWPAAVSWIGGTPPVLLAGAGQTSLVYFYFDGTTYFGSIATGASPQSILPWTDVVAGTALAASLAKPNLSCDASGAQSTVTLPTAAQMAGANGFEFTIKATGNVATPVVITAGAGTTIELLNTVPGTFGAGTWLSLQGQTVVLKYDLSTTQWKVKTLSKSNGTPGQSAYNPGWYAAGTIVVDPAAGLDSNAGTSNGAALKTYAEAVRRWGSVSPQLRVTTSLTFISSHTDNTDPVVWMPVQLAGAQVSIQGAAPATTAAVFTLSAAKNRAAGANSALIGSFSAGVPAAGVMVENTTAGKSSRAFIHRNTAGANWIVTQPVAKGAVPATTQTPAEVDTWASTDTVNLLAPIAINLVQFAPTLGDINVAGTGIGYLFQCVVLDPAGPAKDPCLLAKFIQVQEVVFQRGVSFTEDDTSLATNGTGATTRAAFVNNYFLASGFYAESVTQSFSIWAGGTNAFTNVGGSFSIGGDYVAGGFGLSMNLSQGAGQLINVFQDCNFTVFAGEVRYSGVIYGTTGKTLNHLAGSKGSVQGGATFTATFTQATLVAGIQLNSATTGNSIAYAGNVGTIHNGITTSVANLDAAAGAAGFGGTAFNPGGASISNAFV